MSNSPYQVRTKNEVHQLSHQVEEWPKELEIEGWPDTIYARTGESKEHVLFVTEMTMELAKIAGVPECDIISVRNGALLHDVGKVGVPQQILQKTGCLSNQQWQMIRRHPNFAYDLLYPISYFRPSLAIPLSHHERWDGEGYPQGLKGEEIPLAARLFQVVDAWDSLTSDRAFRRAWPEGQAFEYIQSQANKQFDPKAVDLFTSLMTQARIH